MQILILFGILRWFGEFLPHILGGTVLFSAIMVICLLNGRLNPAAKITWLIIILNVLHIYMRQTVSLGLRRIFRPPLLNAVK